MKVIAGRWKAVILYHLFDGPKRLSELKRLAPGASQKVLIEQLRELEEHGENGFREHPAVVDRVTPMHWAEQQERMERVRSAVLELPAEFREAVLLCELEELSYEEAAQLIGCPIGTIRSRLHRGRALLLAKLEILRDLPRRFSAARSQV